MAVVIRLIIMLNHLCWAGTMISIPEERAMKGRSVCSYKPWWACMVLMSVKRIEELLRGQPANRENGIVQGRVPWGWQRR